MKIYLLFFIFSISLNIEAQVAHAKWTIKNCFDYASEHNNQLNLLKLQEQSSQFDLFAAEGDLIPSLSASINNNFNHANNNISGNGLLSQLTSVGTYSLSSSIVLWNHHYIKNNIQHTSLLIADAKLAIQQMLNDLILIITKEYLDILLSKENLVYITNLVNTSQERLKQGQYFFEQGVIAKKDLLQLQAQLASDQYLMVQANNAIRQNFLLLHQTMQLPADSAFDIEMPRSIISDSIMPALEYVQQTAVSMFPEIKRAMIGVDMANVNVRKSESKFRPSISATASLGTGYSDIVTNNTGSKINYFTQTGNNFYQRVGLNIAIPIFSNRVNKSALEKNKIAFQQANVLLQNGKLILSQSVEQAYLNAVNAKAAFESAKIQLNAAVENDRMITEQFNLGAINVYDLLQQRNQYVQSVQAFTQAKYMQILNKKVYEFYLGNPISL